MGKNKNKNTHNYNTRLRAKLSFDEGFAERPLYTIKAFTTEKNKGVDMLDLIEKNFNISKADRDEAFKKKMEFFKADSNIPTEVPEEMKKKQIKWTKDEKGNIV